MKVTLRNGVVVEGTLEQVKKVAESFGFRSFSLIGDGVHYFSESKGTILITAMDPYHLRNAILKYYKTWVEDLHAITNPKEVVQKILNGPDDKTWIAMVKELSSR